MQKNNNNGEKGGKKSKNVREIFYGGKSALNYLSVQIGLRQ